MDLSVECRTHRNASRGRLHTIQIAADWSVTTPHDLEAERIAAAFGGYTSCLELVDRVIPAVAQFIGILTREDSLPIRWGKDHTSWLVPRVRTCECSRAKFRSAQAAAAHLRSAEHLSRQFKVPARQLSEVLDAVRKATPATSLRGLDDAAAAAAPFVHESSGVSDLWAAGIHPARIPEMAEPARSVEEPLPVAYYLGIAYGDGVHTEWLRQAIAARPDPAVASWLSWIPADSDLVTNDIAEWLRLGLSRRHIELVIGECVRPEAAHALAAHTQRSSHAAARVLAVWAAAGCQPTVAHVEILDRHGLGSTYQPSRSAVDRLVEYSLGITAPPSRTELGVLLALAGSRQNVEAVLAGGVRSAAELGAEPTGAEGTE